MAGTGRLTNPLTLSLKFEFTNGPWHMYSESTYVQYYSIKETGNWWNKILHFSKNKFVSLGLPWFSYLPSGWCSLWCRSCHYPWVVSTPGQRLSPKHLSPLNFGVGLAGLTVEKTKCVLMFTDTIKQTCTVNKRTYSVTLNCEYWV